MLAAVKTMAAMVTGGVAPLSVLAAKRHVLALSGAASANRVAIVHPRTFRDGSCEIRA
jgi:hypothetical protein